MCKRHGYYISDDNECALLTHDCDADATCTNIPGSWTCTCNNGYSGTGQICIGEQKIPNLYFVINPTAATTTRRTTI